MFSFIWFVAHIQWCNKFSFLLIKCADNKVIVEFRPNASFIMDLSMKIVTVVSIYCMARCLLQSSQSILLVLFPIPFLRCLVMSFLHQSCNGTIVWDVLLFQLFSMFLVMHNLQTTSSTHEDLFCKACSLAKSHKLLFSSTYSE